MPLSPRRHDALEALRVAAVAAPHSPAALDQLARALLAAGRMAEAIQTLFEAAALPRCDVATLHLLGDVLHGTVLAGRTGIDPEAALKALRHPDIDRQLFAAQILEVVKEHLSQSGRQGDWATTARSLLGSRAPAAIVELLCEVLAGAVVNDLVSEQLLTSLRHVLLASDRLGRNARRLALALAWQGRNNGWVWAESDAEAGILTSLRDAADKEDAMLRWSMYRPLESFGPAPDPRAVRDRGLRSLMETVNKEARREAEFRQSLPAVGAIADLVSVAVRAQYEQFPYPRWRSLVRHRNRPLAERGAKELLIAGCGTGKHAIETWLRDPGIRQITAIDLSRASLAYAARMARDVYGIRDIRFVQCDLLNVGALATRFDAIECVGVLHHMAAPAEGLRALRSVLRPGGEILIGLYSRRARGAIAEARRRIAAAGLGSEIADIRKARRIVIAAAGEPWTKVVLSAWDFYSAPDARDLLMHVQERDYTLEEVADLLAQTGLVLEGFVLTAAQETAFRRRFPDRPMKDPSLWAELEAETPQLFQNMYLLRCRPA